jgi:hypothetical protein
MVLVGSASQTRVGVTPSPPFPTALSDYETDSDDSLDVQASQLAVPQPVLDDEGDEDALNPGEQLDQEKVTMTDIRASQCGWMK